MRLLHFADAHIDMANHGRHDPETGLPVRVLDFLKSLDTIIEAALAEKVDLVIFAGDAYKDRSPAPTFQREWGRRIIRLSQAKIPTLLLVGNHDLSPAAGRAHAIQEFDTLQVPYVRVLSTLDLFGPDKLWGLPVQVIAVPWISRSGLMAAVGETDAQDATAKVGDNVTQYVERLMDEADPSLPLILTAHASVQGARYGSERMVMLGADLLLPTTLVRDTRLDYVALGHIHKPQNLNENAHPPVIYPGSIERVDFGEAGDDKFFVIAEVQRGKTQVEWRKLKEARPFVERRVSLKSGENVTETLVKALPEKLEGAIVKLIVEYPRELDSLIDEAALRKHARMAFEFHLVKRPQVPVRARIAADQTVSSLGPLDLLDQYWRTVHQENPQEVEALQKLAKDIMEGDGEA